MDSDRFDALSRSLATVGTRRGLMRLLGTMPLVGVLTTAFDDEHADARGQRKPQRQRAQQGARDDEQKKPNKKTQHGTRQGQKQQGKPDTQRENRPEGERRRVTAQGPCGDGSGKDNTCENDRDCCTRLCDQQKGRCRCKTLGEGCKDDRNCCVNGGPPMTCQSGSCQMVQTDEAPLSPPPPPDAPPPPPPDAPPPLPPDPVCTPTTCAAQGKNCGTIADGCGNQIRCGPDSCGDGYTCTDNRCLCPDGTAVCDGVCCAAGQVCQNATGPCCSAQGKDAACGDRACGPATDNCTGEVYACGTSCHPCFSCVGGECAYAGGEVCGDACCTGTGQTCGGGGTPGVCGCTPTTCFALRDEICPPDSECEVYGICGTFSDDGCGNSLECGTCAGGHPCFACENNRCVYKGGAVCGTACCGSLECCVNPGTSLCGYEKCLGGRCCPVGFLCCNARDGSFKSTCFGTTECGGAVVCCHQGHTCCPDEPCCTSDAQCTGGRRCEFDGRVAGAGCCNFNR